MYSGTEQRAQPMPPQPAEQNRWPSLTRKFSAHSGLIQAPKQPAIRDLDPIWLACQGREANSQPPSTTEYSTQSGPLSKPDQRIQASMEPLLQPHLCGEPSQQPYTNFSGSGTLPPSPFSELKQVPHPKQTRIAGPSCPRTLLEDTPRNPN